MNDRTLPSLRRGIRNQNRLQRLLANRAAEQKVTEEVRYSVAQKNLRARQVAMLQVPTILSTKPFFKDGIGLWGSHTGERQPPRTPLRSGEREVRVRSASEVLPHFTTRKVGQSPTEVRHPRVSVLAVAFGILLATSTFPVVAAAPDPRMIMEDQLTSMKKQWKENERHYQEEQARIHALAEKARGALCSLGEMQHCKNALHSLARAVATAETQNCTTGVGDSKNNCFGIKRNGVFVMYPSAKESYADFMEMWPRLYGWRLPTYEDAQNYTGNPDPTEWLNLVLKIYSTLPHD